MRADFWLRRWAEGRTGFHLEEVNPILVECFAQLEAKPTSSMFVPMCGKTVDMPWLAERVGMVIGNELSQQAVETFFRESGLQPHRDPAGLLEWYSAGNIKIACGDFFHLSKEDLHAVDLVYDRAALIALPEDMRAAYAAHLAAMLGPNARMLLVTLEYDQSKIDGPPFAVAEDEVHSLYVADFEIELLHSRDALEDRFRDRGLSAMQEKAYILRRRDNA